MSYPSFAVPGVKSEDVWQLFNCSNLEYYRLKVQTLRDGVCGFCTIDSKVNTIYFETNHWIVMENSVAPRSDQVHQFVIPSKRHVFSFSELHFDEVAELSAVINLIDSRFNIDGGVIVIRSGNPARNARSMPHLHVNYHVPTGEKKVEITIAKSEQDLEKKLPVLLVFEKMRIALEQGNTTPFDSLDPQEQELVRDKLGNKGSC